MPEQDVREISRLGVTHQWENGISFEAMNAGSSARMADAMETIAKSYIGLLDRIRYQAEDIESLRKWNWKLENRVRGLRGALTRKKKAAK